MYGLGLMHSGGGVVKNSSRMQSGGNLCSGSQRIVETGGKRVEVPIGRSFRESVGAPVCIQTDIIVKWGTE